MHLKFLERGTGSAAEAAAYLLADKDAAGKPRARVEVLRGDPTLVAAIADGLPFQHRYTSGVCAWSAEDAPTRAQIERFIDEFEKTAWSGLDPERYVWAAVAHWDDAGGVHVHKFAARCDLATNLSLNVAPPGWQEVFDPLRDAFNYTYGWSRPDDPARARPTRPASGRVHRWRAARRAGQDVEPDAREEIGEHLLGLVAAGKVKDRAGVVAALEGRGYEVPRQGEHYVTARNRETGERWRLRGALYERGFDGDQWLREAPEPSGDRERAAGGADPARAAEAWKKVEEKRRRRADYHRTRYGRGSRTSRDPVRDAGRGVGDVEQESGSAAAPVAAERDASLAAHLQRELGDHAVVAVTDVAGAAPDRRPDADGRGERGLAAATLAGATRAAGPDLLRALSEHVAIRERAAVATSMGEQWLSEAQREVVVESEGRRLTVEERAHAVEKVEGRLEADLLRRKSELVATSLGPVLLREAFGERGDDDGDMRLSFANRDRGLGQVEQQVGDALTVQEEALRSIPFGRQCLSEEAQGGSGDAEGVAASLAARESRVRVAEQRVAEELDVLEQEHVARAGHEGLLVEAIGTVVGGESRPLSLEERWEVYGRARSAFNSEERTLDHDETAVRSDPAGEALLRTARLEVLGADDREATLAERARIVKAAAAAQKAAAVQRDAEELQGRETALRSIPPGERYLSEATREALGGAPRSATPSERYAIVGMAEQRLGAALDDREERLVRSAGGSDLLVDAFCELSTSDSAFGDGSSLPARWQVITLAEQWHEEDRAEDAARSAALGDVEAMLKETSTGAQHLAAARQEVVGEEQEPSSLTAKERVVDIARSRIQREQDDRAASLSARQCGAGAHDIDGGRLYAMKLTELEGGEQPSARPHPGRRDHALTWAERQMDRLDDLHEGEALHPFFARLSESGPSRRPADIERWLDYAEEEQRAAAARREARIDALSGDERVAFEEKLDEIEPQRRETGFCRGVHVDAALDYAHAQVASLDENIEGRRAVIEQTPGDGHARLLAAGFGDASRQQKVKALTAMEAELAEDFARREERIRSDDAGEEFLRHSRHEVLGDAGRGAATLAERGLIIERAEALWREAEAERRRPAAKNRRARVEGLFAVDGGGALLFAALDARKPGWRGTETGPADIDPALDVAELQVARGTKNAKVSAEHEVLVNAERTFRDATSADWLQTRDRFPQGSIHANVSQWASDRALVCALVSERDAPPASPTLVQRMVTWLRAEVDKLLQRLGLVESGTRETESEGALRVRSPRRTLTRLAVAEARDELPHTKDPVLDSGTAWGTRALAVTDLSFQVIHCRLDADTERDRLGRSVVEALMNDDSADLRAAAEQQNEAILFEINTAAGSEKREIARKKMTGWFKKKPSDDAIRVKADRTELPPERYRELRRNAIENHIDRVDATIREACDRILQRYQGDGGVGGGTPPAPPAPGGTGRGTLEHDHGPQDRGGSGQSR